MTAAGNVAWLRLIERARDTILNPGAQPNRARLGALGLRRIPRTSNRIYIFQDVGRELCLKFYQSVPGQGAEAIVRAEREWQALSMFASRNIAWTPRPVIQDAHPSLPAIIMERVGGRSVGRRRLTARMLDSLAQALAAFHRFTPDDAPAACFASLVDPAAWQVHFPGCLAALDAQSDALHTRHALAEARRWLESEDPAILLTPAPAVLSRADANFANCIWDGRRMALVDFEYCGWRDRAYDLADLIELDGAYEAIYGRGHASLVAWNRFVDGFALSATERERFRAARRFLAWIWALRFWPQKGQDDHSTFVRQLRRIGTL